MQTLTEVWEDSFKPYDRRPIPDWALDNVTLFPPLTQTGKFNAQRSRHFIPIFAALQADAVREVNVMGPVRGGKSLIGDVWTPWTFRNDPGPFRIVFQNDKVAKSHSEERTMKTLKAVPGMEFQMPTNRHKEREQELIFPDGNSLVVWGPAMGKLQSKGYRYIWASEVWLYKPGTMDEIKGRLGDFVRMGISKLLCDSQGGETGDDWDLQFNSGQVNEWEIFCLSCGHFMLPQWIGRRPDGTKWGFVYDAHKDGRGLYVISKTVPTARFVCEKCGHAHADSTRLKMLWNDGGRYRVTSEPNSKKQSFRWNALIDFPWDELCELWLNARNAWKAYRNIIPTITFWQKRMALPKDESTVFEDQQSFTQVAYEINSEWSEEKGRAITVDRQEEDVYWVTARAWSGKQTRRLFFGKLYSPTDIEALRVKLKVPPNRVFVDSGYRPKGDQGVYAACIKYGWIALKGEDDAFFWHNIKQGKNTLRVRKCYSALSYGDPGSGTSGQGRMGFAKLIRFSSNTVADLLDGLIESGFWVEPTTDKDDANEVEYRRQMAAEYKKFKKNKVTGAMEESRVCPTGNNHAYDCGKMQVLFAVLANLLPDPFREKPNQENPQKNEQQQ